MAVYLNTALGSYLRALGLGQLRQNRTEHRALGHAPRLKIDEPSSDLAATAGGSESSAAKSDDIGTGPGQTTLNNPEQGVQLPALAWQQRSDWISVKRPDHE